ncbi:hypothetical protein CPU12_01610 [Malaciobacter molluscorum LMG 25693]|uniref:peptidylprolyl isomerase n=1 Tax=Malaciobacter molluscorum LMG 25693 TaxID=870501 RepID=A0A2G1DKG8_9BACT|nr:peptidyl-prolyl cis-trans isomerase [Malaciobacter molluscorum]AXX92543.1 peptidyl-prolyl isomerase [Malaciobacter molluscorum LMG 25693]PHO18969.1 hypothetical protein CPU12_01610 [Malaciobacter molluscorum LMG 25693]
MKKIISNIVIASALISSTYASDVLAIVNGENITTEVAPKNFKTLDKKIQQSIINKLIEKKLASDYALSTDVVNDEKYKKVLTHILSSGADKKKNSDKSSLADIVKEKTIKGYTKEQLESKKGLFTFDFLLDKKAENMKPSDKELKNYYYSNKFKYDTPAQIELLSIVVEKKSLAIQIINSLEKAKDKLQEFSIQAKKYSLAPTKNNHGYLGKMPISVLNAKLKPILKDKKRGYFSTTPIKTDFGYEIFYVLNDIPEYKSTFEGVKTKVKNEYIQKSVKSWAINKIKELKDKATIKIVNK